MLENIDLTDSAQIKFGNDDEIRLIHVADDGVIMPAFVYNFNDDDNTACDLIKRVVKQYNENYEIYCPKMVMGEYSNLTLTD